MLGRLLLWTESRPQIRECRHLTGRTRIGGVPASGVADNGNRSILDDTTPILASAELRQVALLGVANSTLLGIVCTALDLIRDGLALKSPFDGSLSTSRLRHDAIGLWHVPLE